MHPQKANEPGTSESVDRLLQDVHAAVIAAQGGNADYIEANWNLLRTIPESAWPAGAAVIVSDHVVDHQVSFFFQKRAKGCAGWEAQFSVACSWLEPEHEDSPAHLLDLAVLREALPRWAGRPGGSVVDYTVGDSPDDVVIGIRSSAKTLRDTCGDGVHQAEKIIRAVQEIAGRTRAAIVEVPAP